MHVFSGFDTVLLAMPNALAGGLLRQSALVPGLAKQMERLEVAPCWT